MTINYTTTYEIGDDLIDAAQSLNITCEQLVACMQIEKITYEESQEEDYMMERLATWAEVVDWS